MKVLVITGATGKKSGGAFTELIGNNLEFIKRKFPDGIRAVVRASSDTKNLDASIPDVQKFIGDLTDIAVLKGAFNEADTVIHIAGIHWSREVVEAAAFRKVRRLILVHTTGIYSKYKEAGEEYRHIDDYVYKTCRDNNIVLTILRPTMIYGNLTDNNVVVFIKMIDKLPFMPVVNGAKYELQPVHYKDLAEAYFQVLVNETATANKDYILSGEKPILLRDMFQIIGNNLGKSVKFISCPYYIAYSGAWLVYCFTFKKIDFRERVQRLCEPRAYSHSAAREAFSYSPRAFEVGIVDEIKEYLQNKVKNK